MPFTIDSPNIVIEYMMLRQALVEAFPQGMLHRVTPIYFTAECVVFDGIVCMVGFHFKSYSRPYLRITREPTLEKLEFFRSSSYFAGSNTDSALLQSFSEFQQRLESRYGPPTVIREPVYDSTYDWGYPAFSWQYEEMWIYHSLFERQDFRSTSDGLNDRLA